MRFQQGGHKESLMDFNSAPVTLFEVSWEVCNKVGGIYSVVSSKALLLSAGPFPATKRRF